MLRLISLIILSLTAVKLNAEDYPMKQMLIEPAELAKSKEFVVLDVRPATAYAAGHVPNAVRVDGNDWAKNFQDGKDEPAWLKRLSNLGLTPDSRVVVYDDASNKDAARIWWILKFWGIRDVRLLNGMWTGWKTGKCPQSKEVPMVVPTKFTAQTEKQRLATKQDILQLLSSKSTGIVDARTEAEHTGKNKLTNKYGGCMPGAKNLDWVLLVDSKTNRFKTAAELKELFDKNKIDLDQPQVAHCQGGGRSSVMNFAMELMGAKNVRNYHASWGEWGNSDDVPIEVKGK